MTRRLFAIGLLTLGAALWPTPGSAKDTHAAKPAAAPAQHGAGADAKAAVAKDAHGAKPAATPAQHGAAAGTKTATAKDAHGTGAEAKPATAKSTHGAKPTAGAAPTEHVVADAKTLDAHGKPVAAVQMPMGNDLPSVAVRIKQRMQEAMAARTQQATGATASGPSGPSAGHAAAHAADAPTVTRRTAPAVEPVRIRLSWRVGVTWPTDLAERDRQQISPDGRIALNWR